MPRPYPIFLTLNPGICPRADVQDGIFHQVSGDRCLDTLLSGELTGEPLPPQLLSRHKFRGISYRDFSEPGVVS